ncbi:histidinol-phosphate aminotransferase family protein [filamentous cyanobacterium LEGE 11480]|uniref:Histidinol-phosphate aminotransferase family protein n=1 Tax=Romeriopsis navalis LEGE 11480 TaxID=2777977 RepID=A0A928VNY6_9CYAN|nr:histidinol-phosphate transaminase [Romeriopsis navalis]MBE9030206.1 histidinol-phosphate aminotransferase family protein [Romeriopsis navalis LEGE 11480]
MVDQLQPIHGSTDSGTPPKYDFSSNANALGPNPTVLKALKAVDPTHYPDPFYTKLHQEISAFHQVSPKQVAVGAGASELIVRLTRWERSTGNILTMAPTFGEYARAARLTGLPLYEAQSPEAFLERLSSAQLAFLCIPNNPTGEIYAPEFLDQVAKVAARSKTIVVADLAYLSLTQTKIDIPEIFWRMYAPNKAHGMTGVRAGYLIANESLVEFRNVAPSWVLSVHGEAFLRSALSPAAQTWVKQCHPTLWRWRDELKNQIQRIDLEQTWSQANFGLISVGNATQVTEELRRQDIRVRDCTSFGLFDQIRVSAQDEVAQEALVKALFEYLCNKVLVRD